MRFVQLRRFGLLTGFTVLTCLTAMSAVALLSSCKDDKRHFEPAPKAAIEDEDDDEEEEDELDDKDLGPALAGDDDNDDNGDDDDDNNKAGDSKDGDVAGDGDGGDGDGDSDAGELGRKRATELLAFLDKDLPADIGAESLFTKLAQQCGSVEVCADAPCRAVLTTCSGGDQVGCGTQLMAECPAFKVFAQGASGAALGKKASSWIKELWGDLLVKVRLALSDRKADKVDELAERHGL